MDWGIISLIFITLITLVIGYSVAVKYFYHGFEKSTVLSLIMFLVVLTNSVAILVMMVSLDAWI